MSPARSQAARLRAEDHPLAGAGQVVLAQFVQARQLIAARVAGIFRGEEGDVRVRQPLWRNAGEVRLKNLRAIKYVDNPGDLKSIGLDPPHMKVELTVPGQSQHEVLLVGKPETADNVTPVMRSAANTPA